PVPYPVKDSLSVSFEYKQNAEYFSFISDENLVTFGEFGLIRDVGTQTININPIKFEATTNKIKIYSKIIFKINFGSNGVLSQNPADDFLDGVLLNYEVAKYWNNQNIAKTLNKLAVTNSVLATGKWVKFETPDEGIYRISKSDLTLYGIDANSVDPRTIKIYNNGGKTLPENINDTRPADLVENSILVVGQDDGKFDDGDYILFYGRGVSFWDFDANGSTIKRYFHPYSAKNYLWITSGGSNGKRMSDKPGLNSTASFNQTTTSAFADWEVDKINLGKTGRQNFGDNFTSSVNSRTYTNTLNGRVNGTPINYNFRFAVGSSSGLTLTVSENGNQLISQNLNGYGSTSYVAGYAYPISTLFNGNLVDNRSVLNFSVNPSSVTSTGYLDYFTIQYEKELKAFSDNILFFSNSVSGTVEYFLNGFTSSNIKVFDITNFTDVKFVTNYSMLSGGECRFQFYENTTQRSKYYAVGSDIFKTPINPVEVQNSNLRGEEQGAKFIIITHSAFREAADQLKNYRENEAPVTISTKVADIDQIYNEFSGGVLDPTALRDYLKYAFDNWLIKPQYVLLFGKGTYDYKNIEGYNDNFIPTWQTTESLSLLNSFTTDDFFINVSGESKVDLFLGRITCTNITQANDIVNKIKKYELDQEKGDWRNLVTLIADDGYTSKGAEIPLWEHTRPCEIISNTLPKSFNTRKIYSAAYPDEITGQGRRKPQVNKEIIDAINAGTLFVNYVGHGSPELWAHEVIFEKSVTLPQLKNDKYFFLCAATCDFGYFDIPNYQSAAEALLFLPNSGSIAVYSATRLVFSSSNHDLNYSLINSIFKSVPDTLNLLLPIGKASYLTKQIYNRPNDQKYNILGDPTIRLLAPQYSAKIDSINGQDLSSNVQIKALSSTDIYGEVIKPDNTFWSDFNGEGLLTFYDSERTVRLDAVDLDVNIPGGVIFKGRVSITNGKFSEKFVVPKDISYENKNGKVIFYFLNSSVDGLGYTDKIIVGGTDSSNSNDGKGPEIEIYFDNVAYNNGYLVNENPKLIVNLVDDTGLNTTGTGVGHKLEGILNREITNPIDFSNYFTGDLNAGGKSGAINYNFSSLENGDYELLVKAWDVFNNFSEENTYFTVVDGNDLVIRDIYNYPNPFSEKTQFTFQQNLSKPIDVKIKIYSIAGRLIKEIEQSNINDRFVVIDWDGRDEDGDQLANGTYLYKLIIKSIDGEFNKSVLGKLAVIK
ncbi:MAG: type IX secretion system sortase PorU, partial [Ignavibacteriaceae bacterium]